MITHELLRRKSAYWQATGDVPKALIVTEAELREYADALIPSTVYFHVPTAERGWPNLMFQGIPLIGLDEDGKPVDPMKWFTPDAMVGA